MQRPFTSPSRHGATQCARLRPRSISRTASQKCSKRCRVPAGCAMAMGRTRPRAAWQNGSELYRTAKGMERTGTPTRSLAQASMTRGIALLQMRCSNCSNCSYCAQSPYFGHQVHRAQTHRVHACRCEHLLQGAGAKRAMTARLASIAQSHLVERLHALLSLCPELRKGRRVQQCQPGKLALKLMVSVLELQAQALNCTEADVGKSKGKLQPGVESCRRERLVMMMR